MKYLELESHARGPTRDHRRLWRRRRTRLRRSGDVRRPHRLASAGAPSFLRTRRQVIQPTAIGEGPRELRSNGSSALEAYSHAIPAMQKEAAEKIDAEIRKAMAGR
jgi:hypothetical protein